MAFDVGMLFSIISFFENTLEDSIFEAFFVGPNTFMLFFCNLSVIP